MSTPGKSIPVGLGQSDLSTDREAPAAAPASPVPHRTQCTGKPWGAHTPVTSSGGNGWTQTQHRDDRHAYHPQGRPRTPNPHRSLYPIAPPQRGIRAPESGGRGPRTHAISLKYPLPVMPRGVDGGVTATGVLSRERGNLITISITLY